MNHGTVVMVKQVSSAAGDADAVSVLDIVEEIKFLHKASGTYMCYYL